MKDLSHHLQKVTQKVVRSSRKTSKKEQDAGKEMMQTHRPKRQLRKQKKAQIRKESESRTPAIKTKEERNREMKKRPPVLEPQGKKRGVKKSIKRMRRRAPI